MGCAEMNHRILERVRKNDFSSIRHGGVVMQDGIHIGIDESLNLRQLRPELIRQTEVFGSLHRRIILRENLSLQM